MPIRRTTAPRTWRRRISRTRFSSLRWALDRTNPLHITAQAGGGSAFAADSSGRYEIRPRGNSVTHEDEMMKVASNQMDYEAVTSLYTRSLALIKIAIGKA